MGLSILSRFVLYIFFAFLPYFLIFNGWINYYSDYITSQFRDDTNEIYDFIIVGAGSGGSPLINRLSKNNKVLVIEAGGEPLYLNSIPGLAAELMNKPQVDWMHKTVPQKHAMKAFDNQVLFYNPNNNLLEKNVFPTEIVGWPRGKLLGGSSNLNYMIYTRGHPRDYDFWANLTGDASWKYENLLPYFKKSLNYNGKFKNNKKHYENTGYGYLSIEEKKWRPMYSIFINAAKEMGFEEIDVNAGQKTGFGIIEVTQKNGKRHGTFSAFLKPVLHRDNLRISKYSTAEKIKLDKNGYAQGVYYRQHGVLKYARASKEIIISAGTVNSAKLLLLSGIGPKYELEVLGIKPKLDLPVGRNLVEHVAALIHPFVINETISFIPDRDFDWKVFTDYFFKGSGFLTSPTGFYGQGFLMSSEAKKTEKGDYPDLQLFFAGVGTYENMANEFSAIFGVNFEKLEKFYKPFIGKDGFIMVPTLGRPKSVGELKLKDKNPNSEPLINPRYLEHPSDVKAFVEGVKFAVNMVENTKSFQKIGARLGDNPFPGCEEFPFKSDEYFECYVKSYTFTLYHAGGTCRMGKESDPNSVVDSKLKVIGTKNLRVADISIMPKIVNANTNAAAIMIGERAADIIREFWANETLVCDKIHYYFYNKLDKCFYFNNKMF